MESNKKCLESLEPIVKAVVEEKEDIYAVMTNILFNLGETNLDEFDKRYHNLRTYTKCRMLNKPSFDIPVNIYKKSGRYYIVESNKTYYIDDFNNRVCELFPYEDIDGESGKEESYAFFSWIYGYIRMLKAMEE